MNGFMNKCIRGKAETYQESYGDSKRKQHRRIHGEQIFKPDLKEWKVFCQSQRSDKLIIVIE